ncbi:MAG: hypothetical protein L0Y56_08810, partial [Nitrospira sp.]|nr:hypothetical protein [Nitrospira sp.]
FRCHFMTTSFVDRSRPSVPEGLETCRASGAKGILVLPCLLFHGIVLGRIHHAVGAFKSSRPNFSLTVAPCLGVHSKLVDLVVSRIQQCESQ